MDRLWTPWRYAYITKTAPTRPGVPEALDAWPGPASGEADCVFCNMIHAVDYAIANGMPREEAEREALIVARGATAYLCLNRYPYSTGHVMIVPYTHTDSLASLAPEVAQEMMATAQRVETMLRSVYRPHGLNFGLNLGEAAGAGVAAHLHLHALPRWSGDTNFMTVTAETRVLPETLETTWQRLRDVLPDGPAARGAVTS
jgi:ATP adenylyltransferase